MNGRTLAIGLIVALNPMDLQAQDVPRHTLAAPVATYADGLGSMRGVRELSDGRVLVADGLGEALIVWTPGAGADTLMNTGQGPEEYRVPDGLFPLPNDGTLLVDLGNARLTEIGSDLSFGETWPLAEGGMGPGMTIRIPVGTDDQGRIYFQQRVGGMMNMSDTALIARFDPASDATDHLGSVRLPEQKREESGGANNRSVNIRPVPLSPQDAWNVAWDGRVAVARAGDYRLDWIDAEGAVARGGPVAYQPVSIRRADQEAWLETLGGGLAISMESDGGPPRMSFNRMGGSDQLGDPDDYEWPDEKPAFPGSAVRVDAQGHAWVERHRSAGEPRLFDVFDASGNRVHQVELPVDRRLVGFGEGTVYLTRSDQYDFAWLEQYAAPGT